LRKGRGYTQSYVAAQIYITEKTYSAYETGRIKPPLASLCRLKDLYQVSAEYLLRLTVPPELRGDDIQTDNSAESTDDMQDYLDFISIPENEEKYSGLITREKQFLYYANQLTQGNYEKILEQMKVEIHYQNIPKPAPKGPKKPFSIFKDPGDSGEKGKK
jgi:transcriptional regulator with XRE-family HTH domain